MKDIPIDMLMKDPRACELQLSQHLMRGELCIVLGAGISHGIGLPNWPDLVKSCLERSGMTDKATAVNADTSNEDLRRRMEDVESQSKGNFAAYQSIVRDSLYEKVPATVDMKYGMELVVNNPLLNAVGALMMGSSRGSVRDVITYNFDDLLEWYLELHGFTAQVVTSVNSLRGQPDVVVTHPHGLLSHFTGHNDSNFLTLSQRSYDERLGDDSPWRRYFGDVLRTKVAIFIGLSGNDPIFGAVTTAVQKKLEGSRLLGVWLRGPSDPVESDQYLQDRDCVPLRFDSYEDWAPFLLGICSRAASHTIRHGS